MVRDSRVWGQPEYPFARPPGQSSSADICASVLAGKKAFVANPAGLNLSKVFF
jgi:hypothetical protein